MYLLYIAIYLNIEDIKIKNKMNYIYLIQENVNHGFNSVYLDIVSLLAIICGIFVIVSKNPIVSVLYLIGLFLSISVYLMLQGLNFIGLSYLLVYVGAVSILFLFILMLINVRISEIVSSTSNSIPLGILVGTILYTIISKAYPHSLNFAKEIPLSKDYIIFSDKTQEIFNNFSQYIGEILSINTTKHNEGSLDCENVISQTWDGAIANFSHINVIGNVIYTSYSMWLLLTSIVLLLAMVGTIVITVKN